MEERTRLGRKEGVKRKKGKGEMKGRRISERRGKEKTELKVKDVTVCCEGW